MPGAARILQQLKDLLWSTKERNASIEWSEQSEKNFGVSKRALDVTTMLAQPINCAPVNLAVQRDVHQMYTAVKLFRHAGEGKGIAIYTDHKPLI
jgi:hypothetical protein